MSLDKMSSINVKWFMPLLMLGVIQLAGCGSTGTKKEEASGTLKLTEAVKVNRQQYEKLSPQAKNDFDRALVAIQKDDNKTAEGLLQKIVKDYPAFLSAPVNLGILYYKSGRIPQAEGILKGVVKVDATNIVAFNYLGIVYRQQGKFKEAESSYKSALKISPEYVNAHLNLGILYDLYLQDLDKALESYNMYLEISGEDKEVTKWIFDLKNRMKK